MSVEEMQAGIDRLLVADLRNLEDSSHGVCRAKRVGLIYDDAHGVVSEGDLVVAADAAFLEYDREVAGTRRASGGGTDAISA